MKELTKRKKIIGTIETVLAAAVIIIAVVTAPKLSAQKGEETSAAASETAAATQAATETEPEKNRAYNLICRNRRSADRRVFS